jgi:YhhN-like protein.
MNGNKTLIICSAITFISLIMLALYISEKLRGFTIKGVLRKSMVSFGFLAIGIIAMWESDSGFGVFILLGLLFGLLGDIWLDLKFVHRDKEYEYTHAGFKCFAFGHIMYILGMLLRYGDFSRPLYIIIPVLLGLLSGFAVVGFGKIMKLDYGKFRDISMVYGAFLFGDCFLAGSLALMNSFSCLTLNLMFIGLVLFAISDLVLSGTYFGEGHDKPIDIILNYITYYPGQFLIAWAIFFSAIA